MHSHGSVISIKMILYCCQLSACCKSYPTVWLLQSQNRITCSFYSVQNLSGYSTGNGLPSELDDSGANSEGGNVGLRQTNKQPTVSSSPPSFTLCTFVKVHKLPSISIPLFFYTGLTWRVSVGESSGWVKILLLFFDLVSNSSTKCTHVWFTGWRRYGTGNKRKITAQHLRMIILLSPVSCCIYKLTNTALYELDLSHGTVCTA